MGKTSELLSLLKTGNSDAARRLIAKFKKAGKKKASAKELNLPDDNGQTVIHFCAAQNFVEFLQDLAELGASVDLADNKGYTPLHLAAASGRTSAVTALIRMGADPNISSRTGDTALHLASHGGHATSVEMLVAENANCTMLNVSGYTPLDLACQSGHAQVVSLLLYSGQFSAAYLQRSDMPHTALMLAAKQGHIECIALLVKHGFDVNRKLPGGNGGTGLHEAALHGKVDAVRYLIQCGADVQKTNAQGHTALDIVNMYTDPQTASIMKQVLQDALAQLARSRIAQQRAAGQASHRPPPAAQQPPGFSYFPGSGQPVRPATHTSTQRQMSEESPQHRQFALQNQRQGSHPHPSAGYPHQLGRPPTGGPNQFSDQSAGHHPHQPVRQSHQSTGHPHPATGYQSAGHPHPATGYQSAGHPHLATGSQAVGHPHRATGSQISPHSQQASSQVRQFHQPTGPPHYNASQSRQPGAQSHSHAVQSRSHAVQPPQSGQFPSAQVNQQKHSANPDLHGMAQPSVPPSVQHIYPKPGTPEAVRKAHGIGGDLAAIIAAKAASRKPIVTSPTRKESVEVMDEQFTRSATVSGEPGMQQARAGAQHRRSSVSDRSSASPERGDAPMLPRRTQAGPPSFKPVPPPSEEPREKVGSELEGVRLRVSGSDTERQQASKTQHTTPTPASEANELMAKLKRRQNKIIEAEQATPEQVPESVEETVGEQRAEEEHVQMKPPPPPQRKTPTLSSVSQPAPVSDQAPAALEAVVLGKPKKVKPPPAKPKEVEPEMSPWQQEIAARKARMADHEKESELEQGGSNDHQVQERVPSPAPLPKPAAKPKRSKAPPPVIRSPVPVSTQDQPLPPAPLSPQPPAPAVQDLQLPAGPTAAQSVEPSEGWRSSDVSAVVPEKRRPYVVVQDAEPRALPPEVSTLVPSSIDQLSRSTSMSSLTAGTGSPQLSHVEHMPVLEWLTSYKLADYAPVLEGNGYDTTELMIGITHEELQEMGITKIGHRKKLISALTAWPQDDHFLQVKPESVSVWLSVLNMSQYEATLIEAGYDDIDFISDMTLDDLQDIGITKRGHVKRLLQGIGELTDLIKSFPTHVSTTLEQSAQMVDQPLTTTAEEHILPPPDSWTDLTTDHVDFSRVRGEKNVEVNRVVESGRRQESTHAPENQHASLGEWEENIPPLPPKRNSPRRGGTDVYDAGAGKSFSVEDITAALGEQENEFGSALHGLTADEDGSNSPVVEQQPEQEPDQLLADIDDMLADLTTHLDFMIPG